ncbi:MAG: alpha-amylase family glycosyl hydrolase [Bacteroidota bacterium]
MAKKKSVRIDAHRSAFEKRKDEALFRITHLYDRIYGSHPDRQLGLDRIHPILDTAFLERPEALKERDHSKLQQTEPWFLSQTICGMSLYVDRFCGTLKDMPAKLDYLEELGVNFLHLMPLMESPADASDGGYAVSDFRTIDARLGTMEDLHTLQKTMQERDMYLMLDIVFNHTSDRHEWAQQARKGIAPFKDYYYFFNDRRLPDQFDEKMPEIFPEAAPGNFTWLDDYQKWVMTVFHSYQWDLNYRNPIVFAEMLDVVLFYANLGVDLLRIDAPAFIWKELGTTSQNLPQAHILLQLLKQCVYVSAPGMALLAEAIVAPKEIMKYFGEGEMTANECDFAYQATQMALQWDALATADTLVMLAAQHELLQKPYGTTWITYTRCHDDIGLGYDDSMIRQAGYEPFAHRRYIRDYYLGHHYGSPSRGALFSVNERTGDARISGSLAALCGLEAAWQSGNQEAIDLAIRRILLMQAQTFFIGGLPMLFYGDETGHLNDYSYQNDPAKSYDNRWMHRPRIDWNKNERVHQTGTIEQILFSATQKLLRIRKSLPVIADKKNLTWLTPHNRSIAGWLRAWEKDRVYCLFNYSDLPQGITWYAFKEHGLIPTTLYDHWTEGSFLVERDEEHLIIEPYGFRILEMKK